MEPVRPSFKHIYMSLAWMLSERSTCKRLKVGCVIVSEEFTEVYSIGYNGNAAGLPNTCDSDEPGRCGCLHAESNAIIKCYVRRHIPKLVFVTHMPCKMCAKSMVNLGGVKEVFYDRNYRIIDGLDVLDKSGILHEQFRIHLPVGGEKE